MSRWVNSRFRHTPVIRMVDANGSLLEYQHNDLRQRLTKGSPSSSREYSPTSSDTWSRIAWKFLGDGRHYWIIADLSDIIDPFGDLHPKETLDFLSRLSSDLSAGTASSITVDDPTRFNRGMLIRIEDLDLGNLVSVDVSVLSVDNSTGVITFSPTTVPDIPALLSRVSRIVPEQVRLNVPSYSKAIFEALDFDDTSQTLVR